MAILVAEVAVGRVLALLRHVALRTTVVAQQHLRHGWGIRAVARAVARLVADEARRVLRGDTAGAVLGEVAHLTATETRGSVGRRTALAALMTDTTAAIADHV